MKLTTILFYSLFWLFLYKLTFLSPETPNTPHRFTLARDTQGVPHVYAKTYKDLVFGLGYAEAQDRLFGLYFKKMLVEGRTA